MKKIFVAVTALLTINLNFAQPPQGPQKPPPPEDRWQHDSKKINDALGLSQAQLDKLKTVFLDFYKDMDALREKMQPPKPPKEDIDKIVSKRDEQLKKILSGNQLSKFSEVEKTLGPPKRQGDQRPPAKNTPTK